jgi:hypothetical protein
VRSAQGDLSIGLIPHTVKGAKMAKPTDQSQATLAPNASPTYTTSTSYDFSLIVNLGSGTDQKEVILQAANLAGVAENGLHFSLPDGTIVQLGTLSEFIKWLNSTFSISIPATADDGWPDFIKTVYTDLVSITVTLDQFSLDQDKKDAGGNYPPLKYNLTVTAKPASPLSVSGIPLSVVGGGVGVTRTYTITAAPPKT